MDCSACQIMLSDYRAGALPGHDRDDVQSHLASCAVCREHLAADEALEAVLTATPLRQPPAGFTAAVLTRVQAHPQAQPAAAAAWLVPVAAVLSVLAFVAGLRRLLGVLAWDLVPATWLRQVETTLAAALDGARAGWGWLPAWPPALAPHAVWLVAAVLTVAFTAVWGAWRALERA
jgi:predicted anti-sigma-YlaC factor YlaD